MHESCSSLSNSLEARGARSATKNDSSSLLTVEAFFHPKRLLRGCRALPTACTSSPQAGHSSPPGRFQLLNCSYRSIFRLVDYTPARQMVGRFARVYCLMHTLTGILFINGDTVQEMWHNEDRSCLARFDVQNLRTVRICYPRVCVLPSLATASPLRSCGLAGRAGGRSTSAGVSQVREV